MVAWTGFKQKPADKEGDKGLWNIYEDKYSKLSIPTKKLVVLYIVDYNKGLRGMSSSVMSKNSRHDFRILKTRRFNDWRICKH